MISPIYIGPISDIFYSSERSKQMTKQWVRNTKTGTNAIVLVRYNRVSDGTPMIEVDTGRGIRHWQAANCEEA